MRKYLALLVHVGPWGIEVEGMDNVDRGEDWRTRW